MDNAEAVDSPVAVDDLFEDRDGFSFGNGLAGFDDFS